MTLKIIAPCLYPDYDVAFHLQRSCVANKLDLLLYGRGEPFVAHGADAQVAKLLPILLGMNTPYVLVTDSRDSLMLSDEAEIMQKFDSYGARLVMSTEKGCWPPDPEVVGKMPLTSLGYDYINAGQYIGEREYIIECLQHLLNVYRPHPPMGLDNSQAWWPLALLRGELDFALDTKCILFQTMSSGETFQTRFSRVYVPTTGGFPCSIHFNGTRDLTVYHQLSEELYGKGK